MAKSITIYTTNTCAYCVMVKKWLTSKNLPYEEVNVEQNPDRVQEMYKISGQMAVPVTVVADPAEGEDGHKDVTIGWNPAKLGAAIASVEPRAAHAA